MNIPLNSWANQLLKVPIVQSGLALGSAFLFLFLMFLLNMFSTAVYQGFDTFQADSESKVVRRVLATVDHGPDYAGGFLMEPDGSAYPSQFGLQGRLFGSIAQAISKPVEHITQRLQGHETPITKADVLLMVLHAIVAASTALVLTLLLYWIDVEFGVVSAVTVLVGIVLSPTLIVFGRNLYWVPVTWFLPMAFSALWLASSSKRQLAGYADAIALLVGSMLTIYVKSLCGYEFLSTIVIASCVPVLYYSSKLAWPRTKVLFLVAALGIGSVVGFAGALATHGHAVAIADHKDGIWEGLIRVRQKAAVRLCGPDCSEFANPYTTKELLSRLNTSYPGVVVVYVFGFVQGKILFIPAFAWSLVLAFATPRLLQRKTRQDKALVVASWISLVAPVSWYILAKPHAALHTHLSYVLWNVPFTLMVSIAAARAWCPKAALAKAVRAYGTDGKFGEDG